MKHPVLMLLGLLAVAAFPAAQAVEILRWERMPLAVPLKVGQERIVFIDRNVRVGVPAGVGERLRVQSRRRVYLRASEPEPTRLQLQDADTGALILLDIAAEALKDGEAELSRCASSRTAALPARYGDQSNGAEAPARAQDQSGAQRAARRETPIPVVLTRFAAQSLYAAAAHRGATAGRHAHQPAPRHGPRHADADIARARTRARVVASGRPMGDGRAPDQYQRRLGHA